MSKFTPGPWTLEEISKAALFTSNGEVFLQLKTRDTGYESSKANARLASAAPQLLEALKERSGFYYERDVPHQSQHPHCQCRKCVDERVNNALIKAEDKE